MHPFIRYGLATVIGLCWVAMMYASMVANISFGLLLAEDKGLNAQAIAFATGASDVMKAAAPVAFFFCVANRRWWPASAAGMVALITVAFSFVAAISFSSTLRAKFADDRTIAAVKSNDRVESLDTLKQRLAYIPKHRPVSVVETDVAREQAKPQWDWSDKCTSIEKGTRTFCDHYRELGVELVSAREGQKLDVLIAEARAAINANGYVSDADPSVKLFDGYLGWGKANVTAALALLMALLLEIGTSTGLTIALALAQPEGAVARGLWGRKEQDVPAAKAAGALTAEPQDPREVASPLALAPPNKGARRLIGLQVTEPKPQGATPEGSKPSLASLLPPISAANANDALVGPIVRRPRVKPVAAAVRELARAVG